MKDKDARSMEAKRRRAAGEASGSQGIARTAARADRTSERANDLWVNRSIGTSIFVNYEPPGRRTLLEWQGPVTAGPMTLLDRIHVTVGRESRVWLHGPNGSGKTSLFTALLSRSSLPADKILWLPQDQTEAERQALVDDLAKLERDARGRVLNIVAALGVDPDQLLASGRPSPGEARKVTLALGLGKHAWCLLLDEPTNHLDLPSIERLEEALSDYPGALLLVTHDETFAKALTNEEWRIDDGALTVI